MLPTLGVSFGLPYPTYQYPVSPFGPQIPNPHFGSISPNGLNLGLLNVNPLLSLQVTKNEHGEKLLKPFVNLHVTPNEGIIGKIGNLFAAKKGSLHHNHKQYQHYHHHLHRYPPPPPPHHYPFHGEEHGPIFSHPPTHFEPHGPNTPFDGPYKPFDGPPSHLNHGLHEHFSHHHPSFYKDTGSSDHYHKGPIFDDIGGSPEILGFRNNRNLLLNDTKGFPPNDHNYQSFYPQNIDTFKSSYADDSSYASKYANYNENDINDNSIVQSLPVQPPGMFEGSNTVSFPTSRRRRDTDQIVPTSIEPKEILESLNVDTDSAEKDSEGRALNAGKRQAYYQRPNQQQKQCGPRAVCCRKPYRPNVQQQQQQPTQQFNNFNLQQQQLQQQQQQQFNYNQPQQQQINYNKCGTRNAQGINGRVKNPVYIDGDSEFGEYPWQAAILKKDPKESVFVCGGTLIDNQHIITAAHCVKTYSGFDLRVRLGGKLR